MASSKTSPPTRAPTFGGSLFPIMPCLGGLAYYKTLTINNQVDKHLILSLSLTNLSQLVRHPLHVEVPQP